MAWIEVGCQDEAPPPPVNDYTAHQQPSYRGTNAEQQPPNVGYQIKTSDFSHQLTPAEFQADVTFYDVKYPYWQYPYRNAVYNQQVIKVQPAGTYHHQSNLGIVGRALPITDYQGPIMSPYWVPLEGM
jgi:hypothetical protein